MSDRPRIFDEPRIVDVKPPQAAANGRHAAASGPGELPDDAARTARLAEDSSNDLPAVVSGRGLMPAAGTAGPLRRTGRRLLLGGITGLVVAVIGFETWDLINRAFIEADWLGWTVTGLGGAALAGLGTLSAMEISALRRLSKVDGLRHEAARLAAAADDPAAAADATALAARISALYADRPGLTAAQAEFAGQLTDAHDAQEALALTERLLLAPIDAEARRLVLLAARDTALATAASPAALLDAAVVLWRNARLVREVAALYGVRPGRIASLRIVRRSLGAAAMAGVGEAGQDMAVDALGGGIAAAVSARLGQGVVNGLVAARIGLGAIEACRPLPFQAVARPRTADLRRDMMRMLSGQRAG